MSLPDLNNMSHAELQQYAIDAIEQGINAWRVMRSGFEPDAVVFIDEYNRALHRRNFGKAVELLTPNSGERVCIYGPDSLRDVVQFDGDKGRCVLHPKRLIDFIDEEIAGAQASLRYLRNHVEAAA
jgi:hypothetical protein